MTPQELLLKAADLIEHNDWTQGAYARNVNGCGVYPNSISAMSFCVVGAMTRTVFDESRERLLREGKSDSAADQILGRQAADLLTSQICQSDVPDWNDDPARTKAEVVQALRAAAERRT